MMTRRRLVLTSLAAGLLIVFACDSGTEVPVPAEVEMVTGDLQTATVGVTLPDPLVVRVVDDDGNAVGDATVSWSAADGGVSPSSSSTGTDGRASTQWTLGTTAGEQTVTAGVQDVGSVTFTATASPGPPAVVTLDRDTARFSALGDTVQLVAEVVDEFGNAVSQPSVQWSSADTTVAVVDQSGRVRSRSVGSTDVTAVADTAEATAVVVVDQAASSVVISPDDVVFTAVGDAIQLTATVTDANGNPIESPSLTWGTSGPAVSVDASGYIMAQEAGTADVTAEGDGATGSIAVDVLTTAGIARTWAGGDADGATAWTNPGNWSPAGLPNGLDTASVPAAATDMPRVYGDPEVLRLVVEPGAALDLNGLGVTVHGDLAAHGSLTGGRIVMDGVGTMAGTVPELLVSGTITLAGDAAATRWARVAGGVLHFDGHPLRIRP